MNLSKETFKKDLIDRIEEDYSQDSSRISSYEVYQSLSKLIRYYVSDAWIAWKNKIESEQLKQAFYFSLEFMTGRMLKMNLIKLGIYDLVSETLTEMGYNIDDVIDQEREPGLGNGGLGRLAACFMDSLAYLGFPGNGNGIRYNYGMFEQRFSDGNQIEWPDDWLSVKNPWEIRKNNHSQIVKFGGNVKIDKNLKVIYENYESIKAVPYDTPMIGADGKIINTLRLWSAELDMEDENNKNADYSKIAARKNDVEKITNVLYPDDSTDEGKLLRLKQEYFFVCAGIGSIVKYFKQFNIPLIEFPNKIAIHINDTHPTMCIPELIRVMIDEEKLSWDDAVYIALNSISYTNHTIMQEALEKWPAHLMKRMLPRIYMIIEEIDRRFLEKYSSKIDANILKDCQIISDGYVRMANLSVIMSHSINGVAEIHSELLKTVVMKNLYSIYPERFNNKTNGITFRRWLVSANTELARFIDDLIGDGWKKDPFELEKLKKYSEDDSVLNKISEIKYNNKVKFANFARKKYNVIIDPNSIFDVQVKRIHEYKRQFLNALHIIYLYQKLLQDPTLDINPTTFIFGGKAASSYIRAKKIIKLINAVAYAVNNDNRVNNKIKVLFVPNYNVSLAEMIIPSANVSEQISTATTEASGTSNMKFMLNGAITLATMDGANIEIAEQVGEENMIIFGLKKEEVLELKKNNSYNASQIYQSDSSIKMMVDSLVNGFLEKLGYDGMDLYDSLLKENDKYFVLKDFEPYAKAHERIQEIYKDKRRWSQMSLLNTASVGKFSSDNTITQYANEIWNLNKYI